MAITKNDLQGHTGDTNLTDGAVTNYISQINAGGTVYDIATHHGIKFKNGSSELTWNGITDITVEIPTLSDLISSPINFIGTVDSDGKVQGGSGEITSFTKGNFVYIQAACTFGGKSCEAGDMAVYDGSAWQVISGENQVYITSSHNDDVANDKITSVELSASAKTVLFVEGTELALKLPANLVKSNLGVVKNADNSIDINSGAQAAVAAKYVVLTYTAAANDTVIGSNSELSYGTDLKNGAVTFGGTGTTPLLASDVNGAWTAGTNGDVDKNAVSVEISGGVSLTAADGSDFIKSLGTPATDTFVKEAIKSATFNYKNSSEANASNAVLTSNPTLTNDTTKFATNISVIASDDKTSTALFTIPGAVSVTGNKEAGATNGVVTGVTLPQIGDASSASDVSYVESDSTNGVLRSIGTPSVTINNANVISSATVENNVLVLSTSTVSATYNAGTPSYVKAQYNKQVFSNAGSVSYGAVETAAGTGYKLESQAVNATLTAGTIKYIGITTASADSTASAITGITPTTGKYTAALSGVSGSIAANTVVTGVTMPTLPTLGTISATGTLTGSVGTELTKATKSVATLTTTSINLGSYALSAAASAPSEESGKTYATVGANGNAEVTGSITIPASTYVTDVYADADLAGSPAKNDTDKVTVLA